MAGVDVVSAAISPQWNLTHNLTGLRLSESAGQAVVETERYRLEIDALGVRVQDTRSQAWLDGASLGPSSDPRTLALADGTKVTLAWLFGEAEAPPRLGSATITRGDESVVVRGVVVEAEAAIAAQKHQGLASLWADATQPDGLVLHAPTDAGEPAGEGATVPVLRWVAEEGGTRMGEEVSEVERLRSDLHGVIRHTLAAGQAYVPLGDEMDRDGDDAEGPDRRGKGPKKSEGAARIAGSPIAEQPGPMQLAKEEAEKGDEGAAKAVRSF